ncbi:hypothetical protein ACTXIU_14175 [Glutamicibacter arilaitensis]|uniref:hypothetical protein n=1 Tax=Glutamicibacter arilaitensis TaxID=256701 RepID=UPI003FD1BDC3
MAEDSLSLDPNPVRIEAADDGEIPVAAPEQIPLSDSTESTDGQLKDEPSETPMMHLDRQPIDSVNDTEKEFNVAPFAWIGGIGIAAGAAVMAMFGRRRHG